LVPTTATPIGPTHLGIDTGGTFSDFVAVDEHGRLRVAKVPSDPEHPARAIQSGLAALQVHGDVRSVVVGTTVATNAVIQRRGPTVAYITNRGFTDVPFIGRLDKERLYDLHWVKPKPLVHRRDCIGVAGRVDHFGEVLEPLDSAGLAALREDLGRLRDRHDGEPISVAVCLLFSYLRPEHEQIVAAVVGDVLPHAMVSVSHEVSPVWREYERASTTIADAFVKPVVDEYVAGVGSVLSRHLSADRWHVLGSNGGYVRAEAAQRRPAQLILSGLAGGVVGAHYYANAVGCGSFFSLDMGGTSCDIGLVIDGEVQHGAEFDVAFGIPVTMPCVAVSTIGARGGSIAWIDKGGLLHVGPLSAGASPGPVAYGTGGTEPTVTDANITLGRLHPEHLLGGAMAIDAGAARDALAALGRPLTLTAEQAALAVVRTTDENMANAIRLIAVERGLDPRNQALVAFGGAGPLHARSVAERLGITTVLVPPHAGLCAAVGAMISQARVDRVRTCYARSDQVDVAQLGELEREVRELAVADLHRTAERSQPNLERVAAMRYEGQNYELEVALPEGELDETRWLELLGRFQDAHRQQFGFALPGEPVELINLRVTATHAEARPPLERPTGDNRSRGRRAVWFSAQGPAACPIYARDDLAAGHRLIGPAIIEDIDSTAVLFPGDELTVHDSGVLALQIAAASR
jgi:N-methylhydantoinase A